MAIQQSSRAEMVLTEDPATLPRSCTNFAINLVGLAGFFVALVILSMLPQVTATNRTVICILALVLPSFSDPARSTNVTCWVRILTDWQLVWTLRLMNK